MKKMICMLLMLLLMMPSAAMAADVTVGGDGTIDPQTSVFGLRDEDGPYSTGDEMPLVVYLCDSANVPLDGATANLVIWAEDADNPGFPTSALTVRWGNQTLSAGTPMGSYAYVAEGVSNSVDNLYCTFIRPGNYNVYAALTSDIGSGSTEKEVVNNTVRFRSTQIRPAVDTDEPEKEPEKKPEEKPAPVEKMTIVMNLPNQTLQKNGVLSKMDTAPVIRDGRTYVPFRALGEALGAEVSYSPATGMVTAKLADRTITMVVGSSNMMIDQLSVKIDAEPFIENGRTMVPVRAAAEAFGFKVTAVPTQSGAVTDILFAN